MNKAIIKRNRRALSLLIVLAAGVVLFFVLRPNSPAVEYGVNLLQNADFEQVSGEGLPEHWLPDAYNRVPGVSRFEVVDGDAGNSAYIRNLEQNDARFSQSVAVQPNTIYALSGRIKANVEDGRGANLSIGDVYVFSEGLLNTGNEWQQVVVYGRTTGDQRTLNVWARLGGYSADSRGEAWFDDLSLMAVERAPAGATVENWATWQPKAEKAEPLHGRPAWPVLIVVAALYVWMAWWMARALEAEELAPSLQQRQRKWTGVFWVLLAVAAASRLIVAIAIPGYGVDVGCFTSWADRMHAVGPAEFYLTEAHSDYPPGYMLVLWPLGALGRALGTGCSELMIKLPAIISDLVAVVLLYRFAAKHMKQRSACLLAALYAFNPLTYAAGAAWGQVDGVPAVLIVAVVLLAFEGKWAWALPTFVAAALMKPQALMFGPLGLVALVVDMVVRPRKNAWRDVLVGVAASLAVAAVVVLPFSPRQQGLDWLVQLYSGTMNYYAYATVNATNLAFLFGLNWQPVTAQAPVLMRLLGALVLIIPTVSYLSAMWKDSGRRKEVFALVIALMPAVVAGVWPVSLGTLGTLLMVSAFLLLTVRYVAQRDINNLPLFGAVMLILFCVLGAMMHERYLFPAAVLLTLAYVLKRDKRIFWLLVAVSVLAFMNTGVVLDRAVRIGGVEGHLEAPLFGIVSESAWLEYLMAGLQVLLAACALHIAMHLSSTQAQVLSFTPAHKAAFGGDGASRSGADAALNRLLHPRKIEPLKRLDWVLMLAITLLYGVLALTNLGDTMAPGSPWVAQSEEPDIVFDLGEQREFKLLYFGGLNWRDSDFEVGISDDGENWLTHQAKLEDGDLYSWQYHTRINSPGSQQRYSGFHMEHQGRYLRIRSQMIGTTILEMLVRDTHTGERIEPVLLAGNGSALIDEQHILQGEPDWRNSMYFDEIYHARTAYEHMNAMRNVEPNATYEVSHPPLGKVFMSFSLMVFGMNPFGWRFAGTLAGVLMLPGMYLLGLLLTRRRSLAAAAMLLFALDTMHFTQTRIATIDSFATLFIIWSYYFMFRYALSDPWAWRFRATLPNLALSGLFMGLGFASKWTGIYAGFGLAVLFFWVQWRHIMEGLAAEEMLKTQGAIPDDRLIAVQHAAKWRKHVVWTLLWCLPFFVIVPAGIYVLSFLPWFMRTPGGLTVRKVVDASLSMFNYHAEPGRGMDHAFYSPWYQWPIIYKPMWFYSSKVVDGMGSTIITFGNPAVWWGGLLGVLLSAVALITSRLKRLGSALFGSFNAMVPAMLLISFAAQYLPWALVPRGVYIYHYFPSVPFIILSTVWVLSVLTARRPRAGTIVTWVYAAIAAVLFVAFFPYASGVRAPVGWLEAMKWFPGWLYY